MRLGPFELHDLLGRGGMAEVWRATHRDGGAEVAVKIMTAARAREPRYRRAFGREVRAVAGLNHRGIVTVFDHGEVSTAEHLASGRRLTALSPWLVMELGHGTLADQPLPASFEALHHILRSLLGALAHAHARQIVHRDVKPSNILVLRPTGADPLIKLTDFGLSFALDDRNLDDEDLRRVMGSVRYMAPEQILGRWRDQGPWTDLYAVGCTAWWLATGHTPFGANDADHHDVLRAHLEAPMPTLLPRIDVPPGFDAWLERILARSSHRRFQCAADAARALQHLAPPDHPRARPTGRRRMPPHLPGVGIGLFGLRAVPLVGREIERERAERTLHQVTDQRQARMLLITGDAGIGKSRLARWLTEWAHERGAAHTIRALHSPTPGPWAGLRGLVHDALRTHGLPFDAVQERAHVFLRRRGLQEPTWARGLAAITYEHGADDTAPFTFRNEAERHQVAFILLRALCAERPLIVSLDDVQWGEEALRFARFILEAQPHAPLPVLILATARPDAPDAARELIDALLAREDTDPIPLAPLSAPQQQQLVQTLLGLEHDVAQQVIHRAEGNPMFAVQLVGDWVQRGVLVPGADGFALSLGVRPSLPDDILALWDERLERLRATAPEGTDLALELAATLGQEILLTEWHAACQLAGVSPSDALFDAAIEARLLIPHELGFSFVHGLLRERLERRAHETDRATQHHRTCASALASLAHHASARGLAERIAQHWMHARAFEQALAPFLLAVQERYTSGDFEAAMTLLKRWTSCMQRLNRHPTDPSWLDGWLLLARVQRRRGQYDAALRVIERCLDIPDHTPRRQGWLHVEHGQLLSALALLQQRPELYDTSIQLFDQAINAFEDPEDHHGAAEAIRSRAVTLGMMNRLDDARRDFHDARQRFASLDDRLAHAITLAGLADVEIRAHHPLEAMDLGHQAIAALEDLGAGYHVAQALYGLAEIDREHHRFSEAEVRYNRVIELLQVGASFNLQLARGSRAHCLLELGRFDEALTLLRAVTETLGSNGPPAFLATIHAGLLWAAAETAQWTLAEQTVSTLTALDPLTPPPPGPWAGPETATHLAAHLARNAIDALQRAHRHDLAAKITPLNHHP